MGEGEREGCGCDMGWGGERNNMPIRNTVTTAHLHVYTEMNSNSVWGNLVWRFEGTLGHEVSMGVKLPLKFA